MRTQTHIHLFLSPLARTLALNCFSGYCEVHSIGVSLLILQNQEIFAMSNAIFAFWLPQPHRCTNECCSWLTQNFVAHRWLRLTICSTQTVDKVRTHSHLHTTYQLSHIDVYYTYVDGTPIASFAVISNIYEQFFIQN